MISIEGKTSTVNPELKFRLFEQVPAVLPLFVVRKNIENKRNEVIKFLQDPSEVIEEE
jgi:hypothetical protein